MEEGFLKRLGRPKLKARMPELRNWNPSKTLPEALRLRSLDASRPMWDHLGEVPKMTAV